MAWGAPAAVQSARGYGGAVLLAGAALLLGLAPGLLVDVATIGAAGLVRTASYVAAVGLAP